MPINSSLEDVSGLKQKIALQRQEIAGLTLALDDAYRDQNELYDFNSSIYFTIDKDFTVRDLNYQAATLLEYNKKLLINKNFLKFIAEHSASTLKNSVFELYDKKFKQHCEIEFLPQYGSMRYVLAETTLLRNDLIRLRLVDTSQTKHHIKQIANLQKSLHFINTLFQLASDAIAALDSELSIRLINHSFVESFVKIFAIRPEVGMNLNTILNDFPDLKSKILHACDEASEGSTAYVISESPPVDDKFYYCYELSVSSFFNQIQQMELIFRIKNITEYKLQEKQQRKQQADLVSSCRTSAMGEMASALAHEVNQPLTAIVAYSRSCLHIINSREDEQQICSRILPPLEQIANQAERAGEIIHSMKNFMRDGNFDTQVTNINSLIQDALSILHYELKDYQLKITLNLMNNLPVLMANQTHLMQVVLNLARNSIEALKSNKKENPELTIETKQSHAHIEVRLRDNGPGIPKELREKILNTYFTTKPQGTGIGLGICRTLIEGHGGKLNHLQHEDGGACFIFTLPLNQINYAKK